MGSLRAKWSRHVKTGGGDAAETRELTDEERSAGRKALGFFHVDDPRDCEGCKSLAAQRCTFCLKPKASALARVNLLRLGEKLIEAGPARLRALQLAAGADAPGGELAAAELLRLLVNYARSDAYAATSIHPRPRG